MILYICGHDFHYEMENLCRVFFPNEKITVSDTLPESGAPEVETYLDGASGGYSVRVRVNVGAMSRHGVYSQACARPSLC